MTTNFFRPAIWNWSVASSSAPDIAVYSAARKANRTPAEIQANTGPEVLIEADSHTNINRSNFLFLFFASPRPSSSPPSRMSKAVYEFVRPIITTPPPSVPTAAEVRKKKHQGITGFLGGT